MPSSELTYAEATHVLQVAKNKAEELGVLDLISVAVTDAAGHLICLSRMDDRWFQAEVAMAKAFSAAALRRDGTFTGPQLDTKSFWRTVPNVMTGRVALGPGGVLLRRTTNSEYHHGIGEDISGAVGVSGSTAEHDEIIARAAATVTVRR
jgi:uncharacterized protein GlcG (DUF336 family)